MIHKFSSFKFSRGFTLIELLVVIAIIGILAAGLTATINPAKRINQARDTSLKSGMGQIVKALQAYYAANQTYPTTLEALVTARELKSLPLQSDGLSFGYIKGTYEVAVWGTLRDVTGLYCWDSTTNAFKDGTSTELPSGDSPRCL